jgi:hypothetical protein
VGLYKLHPVDKVACTSCIQLTKVAWSQPSEKPVSKLAFQMQHVPLHHVRSVLMEYGHKPVGVASFGGAASAVMAAARWKGKLGGKRKGGGGGAGKSSSKGEGEEEEDEGSVAALARKVKGMMGGGGGDGEGGSGGGGGGGGGGGDQTEDDPETAAELAALAELAGRVGALLTLFCSKNTCC